MDPSIIKNPNIEDICLIYFFFFLWIKFSFVVMIKFYNRDSFFDHFYFMNNRSVNYQNYKNTNKFTFKYQFFEVAKDFVYHVCVFCFELYSSYLF